MPALPTFPTRLFHFTNKEMNIERQTLKGGTALSGEEDVVATDGGGRVFVEFSGGELIDRSVNLAWRALVTILEEGVQPVVVPWCDKRHTPYAPGVSLVPHSDGSPFDDESLYLSDSASAEVTEAAALRATTLQMSIALAQSLLGGEWFSINHPTKGWRAYRIALIPAQDDTTVTVKFRPPLREAVDVGEAVDFSFPRCTMVADGRQATGLVNGRVGEAAIRFVEAP